MSIAVALHDQPTIDEQIDSSDSRYAHLHLDRLGDSAQEEPHERLWSGFGPPVNQTPDRAVSERQGRKDAVEIRGLEKPEMKRAVERRDGSSG